MGEGFPVDTSWRAWTIGALWLTGDVGIGVVVWTIIKQKYLLAWVFGGLTVLIWLAVLVLIVPKLKSIGSDDW